MGPGQKRIPVIGAAALAVVVFAATLGFGFLIGDASTHAHRAAVNGNKTGVSTADAKSSTSKNGSGFTLSSEAGVNGGTLPAEYTADGSGVSPELSWTNAPAGTREFAVMMTTLPVDGNPKWNWVLYGIPATTTSLARNSSGIGTPGAGSHHNTLAYEPPASQGPGPKLYTFTVYALSESPRLPAAAQQVTGEVLSRAISSITLARASLNLSYTRR
jgi:phosphatidylethanolamine-binding protein (PEBP) family uncharacterized protein